MQTANSTATDKMNYKILTLNNISMVGLQHLPIERYEIVTECEQPDAIMLRSLDIHDMNIQDSVKAVARAGAGVNNIPVEALTARGIPVFNAPGANANAVKELVLAGLFLAARNICHAWSYVMELDSEGQELDKAVENGKKQFAGFELPGRTLGVIGLGAVGVEVANAALNLGMKVIGYDPQMTVERAWQLSSGVEQASSIDELFSRSDIVTLHVPLIEKTRGLVNDQRLKLMHDNGAVLNFARGGIVDDDAMIAALDSGQLSAYICDFPNAFIKNHPRVTALPHLGASTAEAEENCAVMVAENLKEYLENGNIRHSVNFPNAIMRRNGGSRLAISNANVPNVLGQVTTTLAEANLNIADLLNKSRGDIAYTLIDIDGQMTDATVQRICDIDGVLTVRVI